MFSVHPIGAAGQPAANSRNGDVMTKTAVKLMAMCLLAFSMTAFAQSGSGMSQGGMNNDNMKSDTMGKKAMTITGKIGDDGKTFMGDKDGKSWTIANPDAVKGHAGHHVTVKANVDTDKGEIHVMSVKMAKDTMMKDNMKNDSMQH
jgi:hypothetical protein